MTQMRNVVFLVLVVLLVASCSKSAPADSAKFWCHPAGKGYCSDSRQFCTIEYDQFCRSQETAWCHYDEKDYGDGGVLMSWCKRTKEECETHQQHYAKRTQYKVISDCTQLTPAQLKREQQAWEKK